MDRQRAKELWPIIEAFANGKVIQARSDYYRDPTAWHDLDDYVVWNEREDEEYRIKPEPREFWVNPKSFGNDSFVAVDYEPLEGNWVHVREVLE